MEFTPAVRRNERLTDPREIRSARLPRDLAAGHFRCRWLFHRTPLAEDSPTGCRSARTQSWLDAVSQGWQRRCRSMGRESSLGPRHAIGRTLQRHRARWQRQCCRQREFRDLSAWPTLNERFGEEYRPMTSWLAHRRLLLDFDVPRATQSETYSVRTDPHETGGQGSGYTSSRSSRLGVTKERTSRAGAYKEG